MTRSAAGPDASCPCAIATAGRRTLLAAGVGLGVGLAARMAGAQADATRDRPKEAICWSRRAATELTPLGPDSLPLGAGQVMAWPMDPAGNVVRDGSRLNKVLLVRLDPAVLDAQTEARAADGVVAYSAICPHTGCEVINWAADRQILECPCHNSQYDPKAGARVDRWSIAARPCGAAAARSGWQADGCAAVHRSAGYPAGLSFGEPIDSGQRDRGELVLDNKKGETNVRQTKHVARHHRRRPDAGACSLHPRLRRSRRRRRRRRQPRPTRCRRMASRSPRRSPWRRSWPTTSR